MFYRNGVKTEDSPPLPSQEILSDENRRLIRVLKEARAQLRHNFPGTSVGLKMAIRDCGDMEIQE